MSGLRFTPLRRGARAASQAAPRATEPAAASRRVSFEDPFLSRSNDRSETSGTLNSNPSDDFDDLDELFGSGASQSQPQQAAPASDAGYFDDLDESAPPPASDSYFDDINDIPSHGGARSSSSDLRSSSAVPPAQPTSRTPAPPPTYPTEDFGRKTGAQPTSRTPAPSHGVLGSSSHDLRSSSAVPPSYPTENFPRRTPAPEHKIYPPADRSSSEEDFPPIPSDRSSSAEDFPPIPSDRSSSAEDFPPLPTVIRPPSARRSSSSEEDFPPLQTDNEYDFVDVSPPPSPPVQVRSVHTPPHEYPAEPEPMVSRTGPSKIYPVPTPTQPMRIHQPRTAPLSPQMTVTVVEETRVEPVKTICAKPDCLSEIPQLPVHTRTQTNIKVIATSEPARAQPCGSPPLPKPVEKPPCTVAVVTTAPMVTCDKPSIEDILRKFGYNPTIKLMVQIDDVHHGRYVKALDPLGNIVYVKLDIESGYIAADARDLVITKVETELVGIPHSARKTFFDLAVPESSGVAIEAKHGICFLAPSIKNEMLQEHYHYAMDTTIHTKSITILIDATLNAVPIISLKEIQCNHRMVLQNTEIVWSRIINTIQSTCDRDLKHFLNSLEGLKHATACFIKMHREAAAKLKFSTDRYRQTARQCLFSNSPRTAEYRSHYATTLYNLQRRGEIQVEMARICRVMNSIGCQLEDVTRQLNEVYMFGMSTFRGLEGNMRP